MTRTDPIELPPIPKVILIPKPDQSIVRWILGVCVCLGIAADCLLRTTPWGLNVTCFAILLSLAIAWGWIRQSEPSPCWHLLIVLCLLSLCMALRDTPVLFWLNLWTMGVLVLFLVARPTRPDLHTSALTSLLNNAGCAGMACVTGPFLLSGDVDWSNLNARPKAKPPKPLLKTLILTLPVLIVFVWLFSAADVVFKNAIESLGQSISQLAEHSQTAIGHVVWSVLFCGAAAMCLHPLCLGKPWKPDYIAPPTSWTVGTVEIVGVLGSLCLLFLCFIVIQLRYLFGGTTLVQNVAGLTYAEYARQGFFALLKVVCLLHMVLMAGHWLVKQGDHRAQKSFRWLSLGLITLTIFVFASAFFRLYLYVAAYGLTRARLYAVAVLVWLALVFVFFAVRVLWPKWSLFTGAYVFSFLAVLLCLNVINPDAMITRINLDRFVEGKELDQDYLGTLSLDAIPTLMAYEDHLSVTYIKNAIESHRITLTKQDWRHWNYGRSKAQLVY